MNLPQWAIDGLSAAKMLPRDWEDFPADRMVVLRLGGNRISVHYPRAGEFDVWANGVPFGPVEDAEGAFRLASRLTGALQDHPVQCEQCTVAKTENERLKKALDSLDCKLTIMRACRGDIVLDRELYELKQDIASELREGVR